jgi:hypothetical protein
MCAVVVALYVGTSIVGVSAHRIRPANQASVGVTAGRVCLAYSWGGIVTHPSGWMLRTQNLNARELKEALWYAVYDGRPTWPTVQIAIPLWPVFLVTAPLSVLAWRRRHGHTATACPSCGYDLSGLPRGSPCPECAAVPKG